jgi:hypothetical protein
LHAEAEQLAINFSHHRTLAGTLFFRASHVGQASRDSRYAQSLGDFSARAARFEVFTT